MDGYPIDTSRLSGLLMLGAIAAALVMANTGLFEFYRLIHHTIVGIRIGEFIYEKPMYLWINEGLLVLFFVKIGLETKRELLTGALSGPHGWRMPLLAAFGGMAVPVAIYMVINFGDPQVSRGWAIPVATDAVLAIGLLLLISPTRARPLVAFLTAIAVFDDVGAIAIIGVFFSENINLPALLAAAAFTIVLFSLGAYRIRIFTPYIVVAGFLWAALLASGVHATLAGVALGFALPMRAREYAASPLLRLERDIAPFVMLAIVPAFAFFNTGLPLTPNAVGGLWTPLSFGIIAGLLIGKPLGIISCAYFAASTRIATLPDGMRWRDIFICAIFGGIGFTMSIFIASVAFSDVERLDAARLAVLSASALAAALGAGMLRMPGRPRARSIKS
ncbi:Na+/H+ antiporter NhaA [Hyphococcus sp.]|uniref:Na+/H+ antiporter NhaA n=1 Tax=Hyphococcus sp. TaxID=2038636 RepID=UPI003D0A54C5